MGNPPENARRAYIDEQAMTRQVKHYGPCPTAAAARGGGGEGNCGGDIEVLAEFNTVDTGGFRNGLWTLPWIGRKKRLGGEWNKD
jgi:hypothetical protein